jgi:ABC-2 type transport system permease protein
VIRLIGAELLKIRTTRTFWGITAGAVGLVLLIVVLSLSLDDSLNTETNVHDLLSVAGFSGLLALVLGVVVGAGEYRHGTIAWTLLVTPRRLRAVSAQVLACGLAGIVIGLTAFVLATAVAIPWLSAKDAPLPSVSELLELVAGVVAYAGLAAALGAGLGALLRNQVAGVVIVLVGLFVVDPTLAALDESLAAFTLSGLGAAINGASDDSSDLLAPVTAGLVWALYALLFVALAAIRTANRDI